MAAYTRQQLRDRQIECSHDPQQDRQRDLTDTILDVTQVARRDLRLRGDVAEHLSQLVAPLCQPDSDLVTDTAEAVARLTLLCHALPTP